MPAIWLIDAYRAGERGQVRALAEGTAAALGWPLETITPEYRSWAPWPHLFRRTSLAGLRRRSRRVFAAPWPGLVITAGVRNEPLGRWLREASGGLTCYVHVGKPWGSLDDFDLLVTTPQYRVPAHPRVLHNELTVHGLEGQRLQRAGETWASRFAPLPRPWIGVLVGGDSGPYTLGKRAASRLLEQAVARARDCGGSLLVTTSARTRPTVTEVLERGLSGSGGVHTCPHFLHRYGASPDNPYAGILALADAFVVTGDSIAMLSEACGTGRPAALFDLGGMRRDAGAAAAATGPVDPRLGAALYRLLMRWFPQPLSRDITLVHRALVEAGRAEWLEDVGPVVAAPGVPAAARSADLERAVARICEVVSEQRA
ncbi:ELM1/GtrOC1 family putative glycosyltransferase [uncultured Thiohalocapsa sp.]|uniref:mitochondrial fission ELM1 family protein n=1 Tax=uncultured Thiohalocapsa sp. TaxID=768990 RepID=UPI0025F3EA0C|nr:ELM1/GtrOC1 family putative glycosyltransferase [uncultured Thiohalocapsa sp.]